MNNFEIDITGEGDESLAKTLEIAFTHGAPGGKATHYRVEKLTKKCEYYTTKSGELSPENLDELPGLRVYHSSDYKQDDKGHLTLLLQWHESKDALPLPYPMKIEDAIPFVKGWLANAGDPGSEPGIDGSVGKGWRVFNGRWGRLLDCSYHIVGIQACHALYGK